MIVYAESSAVLAWLLGEPSARRVRAVLSKAERVLASTLTGVECARGLARARAMARVSARDELAALRLLDVAESSWDVYDVSERVLTRARARFPVEPIRTLDALHLATASVFQDALGRVAILTLEDRIAANAAAMGMEVVGGEADRRRGGEAERRSGW